MLSVLSANLIQENAHQTDAVAAKSSALRVQLQKLTNGILAANSAVSEFVLTGNENALNPFRKANDETPRTIAAIAKLCEGNADDLDRIHKISTLSDAAFEKLTDLRQYAPTPKASPRPPQPAVTGARKSVQALVKAVASFQDSETRAVAQSLKSIGHTTTVTQQSLTDFGGAFAIGAGILASVILAAVILRRERKLFADAAEPAFVEEAASFVQRASPTAAETIGATAYSVREVVELAVTAANETAAAREITFRAEIGPVWEFAVGADPTAVHELIAALVAAIIQSAAPGGPITISCLEQPGRMVRMQFQFYGKLVADQLPVTLLSQALDLPGCSIRGSEPGVIWFEFPCVPALTDVANLQKATQSTIGVASPV